MLKETERHDNPNRTRKLQGGDWVSTCRSRSRPSDDGRGWSSASGHVGPPHNVGRHVGSIDGRLLRIESRIPQSDAA